MSKVARYVSNLWTRITDPATRDSSRDLAQKVEALARELIRSGEVSVFASGFIGYFDLESCPAGWTEVTAAQNRVLRGMPSGGTPGATGGNDSHGHSMSHGHGGSTKPAGGHYHASLSNLGFGFLGGGDWYAANGASQTASVPDHSHLLDINDFSGNTGNTTAVPAYIQFLACRKN